jgi:subtilisin family serine protease
MNRSQALVVLKADPLAVAVTARSKNGKVDLGSQQARAQRKEIAAQRDAFKSWLRTNAPDARVIGTHELALNAVSLRLNGTTLAKLRQAPQVKAVDFQRLYFPTAHEDIDLALIDAAAAWSSAAGGDADAGSVNGVPVKVAVVDTGIDATHPCFDDAGFPATQQLGNPNFTNNKVIVAKVFNNKTPSMGYTAEAIQDHGTHVAGTVACNLHTPAEVSGVPISYDPSGVAPAAQLGNYNVFPGEDADARSEDILDALEAAFVDGMDVANMSLGGASSGVQDLLAIGVDNLDRAGMVVAISAGNEGPGHYTVGSPGIAQRALTSGASSVGHFVGTPVSVGATSTLGAAGDFPVVASNLTAPLGVVLSGSALGDACAAVSADLTGKIALISRGACTFSQKIRNAADAGAVAVLVVNNVAGDPTAMASDGTPNQPTVPAYMLGLGDKAAFMAAAGQSTTIGAALSYLQTGNDDIMAGFSSQGPTDVDWRIKPDLVSPGVNVLSSIPLSFCDGEASTCWAFFSGTSMASPHSAGAAAVVIDAFRTRGFAYTAEQVRSAMVNTAEQGGLTAYTNGTSVVTDVNIVGAGQLDLDSAVAARVGLGPVSTSFGKIPGGSAQTETAMVRLSSLTGGAMSVTLTLADPADGASFGVGDTTIDVPASGWVAVPLSVTVARGTDAGDYQAQLNIWSGQDLIAHSMFYVRVS